MELLADRDPEDARKLLDAIVEYLTHPAGVPVTAAPATTASQSSLQPRVRGARKDMSPVDACWAMNT